MPPKVIEESSLGNGCVAGPEKAMNTETSMSKEKASMKASLSVRLKTIPDDKNTPLLNTIATYISKIFGLVLIGYFLVYQHENLNYFVLAGRVVWFVCLLLCCYQEDIVNSIFGTSNATSGSRKPCSIEYNNQVKLVVGLISYCAATYLLVLSTPTSNSSSIIDLIGGNVTISVKPDSFTSSVIGQAINNDSASRSYLFYVFGLLASYYSFEKVFTEWFCRLPTSSVTATQKPNGSSFIDIERILGVPTCLVLMYALKDVTHQTVGYQSLLTTMYGWFAFKVIHLALELNRNSGLKSYSLPAMLANTPLGLKRIAEDAKHVPSSKIEAVIPSTYIWRLYGNEYDVTSYIHKHPGGVETIMLAANREDSTSIFQSYHPFNITKARTVLEKYRVNKKGIDKPAEGGSLPHQNDVFYNVLVERVRDVLQNKYSIDPIADRTAPFDRILFYAAIVTGVIVSLVAHCRVSLSGLSICRFRVCTCLTPPAAVATSFWQGSILGSFCLAFFGDLMAAHLGHDGKNEGELFFTLVVNLVRSDLFHSFS
jgi:Cytochrome b5-like Heme/Steroid binding domain